MENKKTGECDNGQTNITKLFFQSGLCVFSASVRGRYRVQQEASEVQAGHPGAVPRGPVLPDPKIGAHQDRAAAPAKHQGRRGRCLEG